MKARSFVVNGGILLLTGTAIADPVELHWDVNNLRFAVTENPNNITEFGEDFTGEITGSLDANSVMEAMEIDQVDQLSGDPSANEFFFEMVMTFDSGKLIGGAVIVGDDPNRLGGNFYTASLGSITDINITDIGAGRFDLFGITFSGEFDDSDPWFASNYGPVDVSRWAGVDNLTGDFQNIRYRPQGPDFVDDDVQSEVFLIIPLPGAAAMAGVGMAGLVVRRRR